MWQTSAWLLLVGALLQLIQSLASWGRESNVELIEDTRRYNEGLAVRVKELYKKDSWDGADVIAAEKEHLARHMPGRAALLRRQKLRYWWNAAGWLVIVIGAALNVVAASSTN